MTGIPHPSQGNQHCATVWGSILMGPYIDVYGRGRSLCTVHSHVNWLAQSPFNSHTYTNGLSRRLWFTLKLQPTLLMINWNSCSLSGEHMWRLCIDSWRYDGSVTTVLMLACGRACVQARVLPIHMINQHANAMCTYPDGHTPSTPSETNTVRPCGARP